MKKLLLLSLMAVIPCAMAVNGNNNSAPQLSGAKIANSPMQSSGIDYTGLNAEEDMRQMMYSPEKTCPTPEEAINEIRQQMAPEERAQFDAEWKRLQALTPEQQEQEMEQTIGLLMNSMDEMLNTPEGQALLTGMEIGAAAKEQEIIQEAEAILPALQDAIIQEEAEIAKSCPYAPAVKK